MRGRILRENVCSSGNCDREACIRITFIDGRKLIFCWPCAVKIGGQQEDVLPRA